MNSESKLSAVDESTEVDQSEKSLSEELQNELQTNSVDVPDSDLQENLSEEEETQEQETITEEESSSSPETKQPNRRKKRQPKREAAEVRLQGRKALCKRITDIAPHMLKTVKLRILGRYLPSTKGMKDAEEASQ